MKKKILSLFIALAITIMSVPFSISAEIPQAHISFILGPGETSDYYEIDSLLYGGDFGVYTVAERPFSITLTDPYGYTYTGYKNGNFVEGLIEGIPPESNSDVPDNNMVVEGIIEETRLGLRVTNPIFGAEPWKFTITSHNSVADSSVVVSHKKTQLRIL